MRDFLLLLVHFILFYSSKWRWTLFTDAAQHPSSSMEVHQASSQPFTHAGGFVHSHWNLWERQLLHSQTNGDGIQASQETGHEPSDETHLVTDAQTMQDPALAGVRSATGWQSAFVKWKKVKVKVILSEKPYLLWQHPRTGSHDLVFLAPLLDLISYLTLSDWRTKEGQTSLTTAWKILVTLAEAFSATLRNKFMK